ncbi:MAG: tRNA (adenosine(37)-N6)-dimethylallyltransferase MiaA [Planctomycetes bacterium]|nr:tRNA (adenosine(37)-N6)-dimethylallyltransferase MiaA [Planctomycetota bacterium]MCB9918459.1 tRNA (adenosine(37)-N6)-dimethylallyltransferase MiaA [Planctomycetota bacterium]
MGSSSTEPLLVLTGPTASGKSALAIEIAKRHDLEILSVDSMSIYRLMDVGTAKPTRAERDQVVHHGLDLVDPWEDFDAARFAAYADERIQSAADDGKRLLLVGGTPLYLMAILRGFFEGPPKNPALRRDLREREDAEPGSLHVELEAIDAEAAQRIHKNDTKRLVRAIEVYEATGRPISELQRQFEEGPPRYAHRLASLSIARDHMRERVRERTRAMFDGGLVDEVRSIENAGGFSATAGQAIGYAEVLDFLRGDLASDLLVSRVRNSTHRLVRRQETWFRRMQGITLLPVEDERRDRPLIDLAERVFFAHAS